MLEQWVLTSWPSALMVACSALIMYVGVIAYSRLAGLRSFSKMSAFDYIVTLAFGSLMAGTIVSAATPATHGLVALASLGVLQGIVAVCRRSLRARRVFDARPLLLMDGPDILHENLHKARITESDIRQKLREANVLDYRQVRAVVFETTGDIAVLHAATTPEQGLNPDLLRGVRGAEHLVDDLTESPAAT